jgi:AraC-like DNA-binding protein
MLSAGSCVESPVLKPKPGRWSVPSVVSDPFKQKVDRYDSLAHSFLSTNPDSSVYYTVANIGMLDSANELTKLFYIQVFLSEIYLNRLHDEYFAIYWYTEAIKTMNKNPGVELSNPFFLIDFGNLLYHLKLYDNALSLYESAEKIAISAKDSYAEAVAMNNQGLCFQEIDEQDSAFACFHGALTIRRKLMPVLVAQNYLYMANQKFSTGKVDSAIYYCGLTRIELDRQRFALQDIKNMSVADAKKLQSEILAELFFLQSKIHRSGINLALSYLSKSAACIDSNNIAKLRPAVYTALSEIMVKKNARREAKKFALFALQSAISVNDLGKASEIAGFLAKNISESIDEKNKYLELSVLYSDSLIRKENSANIFSNKLLLITSQMQRKLFEYQLRLSVNTARIRYQQIAILLLIMAVILLTAIFIIALRQRNLKLVAYRRIVNDWSETQSITQPAASALPELPLIGGITITEKLNQVVESETVYLKPNLTLEQLATLVGTNSSYLSHCINHHMQTNFNDYINHLRIREACRILQSENCKTLSLDQLYSKVGFTSRSSFYTAFKKFTGITPAYFGKNIRTKPLPDTPPSELINDHQTTV